MILGNSNITIDDLKITSNARFFRKKKDISKNALRIMFSKIFNEKNAKDKKIIALKDNSREKEVYLSAIIFNTESKPTFLDKRFKLIEKKYSYLLLVEIEDILVISSLNVPTVIKKLSTFIEDFGYEIISNTFADSNPIYEKISMQNTSIMEGSLNRRSLEGANLKNYRYTKNSIPLTLSLIDNKDIKNSITMATSRISSNQGRDNIREFINWAKNIILGLKSQSKDKFINNFAKPVNFDDINKYKLKPTAILLNLYNLEELIFNNQQNNYKIGKEANNSIKFVDNTILKNLFFELKKPFNLEKKLIINTNNYECSINKLKKSYSIIIKELNGYKIYDNQNQVFHSVYNFINSKQDFVIVFNNTSYIYTKKQLFKKTDLFENLSSYSKVLITNDNIKNCTNEKAINNEFKKTDSKFDDRTLFGIVENNLWDKNGHLVCDDLGDEWADHIVFKPASINNKNPEIEFFLSKHDNDDTTSATNFHDVIGQAIKNIGNIHFDIEMINKKIDLWEKKSFYLNTQIKKLRSPNSSWDGLKNDVKNIVENPLTIRKMYLVTSFISKKTLKKDIIKYLRSDKKNKKHISQLIWFLSSYVDSCKENNIQPYIICKP